MGYVLSAKIVIPHQLCRNKVFEKYFPEWGFKNGYRKFGPAVPHSLIYKKLKPFRTGIERTFGLVKENRYFMEKSNRYKGIENVNIHVIEHDIVLTQDIIFDYLKSGKISPVLNLNY